MVGIKSTGRYLYVEPKSITTLTKNLKVGSCWDENRLWIQNLEITCLGFRIDYIDDFYYIGFSLLLYVTRHSEKLRGIISALPQSSVLRNIKKMNAEFVDNNIKY